VTPRLINTNRSRATEVGAAALTAALFALAVAATTGVSAGGKQQRTCAPPNVRILASNRFGAVYQARGDDHALISCEGPRAYRERTGEGAPQPLAVGIGGRYYAYPATFFDDTNPEGLTDISTQALSGRGKPAVEVPGSTGPVSEEVDVTKLRLAANQAMVWIACEGAFGRGRLLPQCLRDGRRRWVYARPASANYDEGFCPDLIATGRHIDARYLRFSANGRIVTWRQQGKLKRRDIGP